MMLYEWVPWQELSIQVAQYLTHSGNFFPDMAVPFLRVGESPARPLSRSERSLITLQRVARYPTAIVVDQDPLHELQHHAQAQEAKPEWSDDLSGPESARLGLQAQGVAGEANTADHRSDSRSNIDNRSLVQRLYDQRRVQNGLKEAQEDAQQRQPALKGIKYLS